MTAETLFVRLQKKQIRPETIFLFDLDGTLLDTNLANNEAYKYALWKVTGKNEYPSLSNLHRITRKDIATLEGITPQMLEEIIRYKQNSFRWKMEYIYPTIVYEILKQHYTYTPCYVVTSADSERAQYLISYWGINHYIKECIFADSNDKYRNIANKLNVDSSNIILFEDNESAIANAINNGIKEQHIIHVYPSTLKRNIMSHNDFLKQNIEAFFSMDYMKLGHPDNPNFINILKNQFGKCDSNYLYEALNLLKKYLKRDIQCIYEMMNVSELTVVGIPRAKAENYYSPEQQFFRRGIQEAIEELNNELHLNLIDGSHYITRHTNTKTTHLSKNVNVPNDGDMPYAGITRNTCDISEKVTGKDILLIDDIYTLDVNIDEDAVQALYDKGAKSVRFYSVSKTFKVRRRKS